MDLEDIVILGNGPRYKKINEKINSFKTFSNEKESYVVWLGEGDPAENVRIWIKKTNSPNFSFLIDEMKKCFEEKPNLEYVGVDNFDSIKICPKMCVLLSRQNVISTFQNPNDLDYFILNKLGVNYL